MKDLNGKRILVLGGGSPTVNVVNYAHEMGMRVYVVDYLPDGEAKALADETAIISTTDYTALADYMNEHNIDGVMTGASEFNIVNTMRLCKLTNRPFYATEEQWNICQNKQQFKNLCRQYGVPCVPEFSIDDDPSTYDYPVIVKPTDACSARGISVCQNSDEFKVALEKALSHSNEKRVVIEKFMENKGTTMSVRYIAVDGELYLEAVGDRYVLDSKDGRALITAAAFYPSRYTDMYIQNVDENVKQMFKGLGIKNGAFFMESIANEYGVWFYEMGLRISGGMTYKITEQTNGVNELKMLISYATSGSMCDESDVKKIDPHLNGYYSASLSLPLTTGTIGSIHGMEIIKALPEVGFVTEYWHIGDSIEPKHIGTLDQLFARIPIIVKGKERLAEIIKLMKENISVKDSKDQEMIIWSKLDEIYQDYIK